MSFSSAKLFVLGRTRVGKGEFIKTAVHELTGAELDITSDRLTSYTKQSAGYLIALNGKTVELTDTVGYEDTEGDDASEAAFLQLLGRNGASPYYPPLVVLQALCGSDMAWLKKISLVFPSIVCAVRCKTKAFEAAKKSFAQSEFTPLQLFHLHEYTDDDGDEGMTRSRYVKDVMKICDFYAALSPSREELNYDEKMFQTKIERIKIRTETKTEDTYEEAVNIREEDAVVKTQKIITVDDCGNYAKREAAASDGEPWVVVEMDPFDLVVTYPCKKKKKLQHTKDIVVEESSIQKRNVKFIQGTTIRSYYQRDRYEVWKVLASGIRIFMDYEEGEWMKTDETVVGVKQVKVSNTDWRLQGQRFVFCRLDAVAVVDLASGSCRLSFAVNVVPDWSPFNSEHVGNTCRQRSTVASLYCACSS